jgi:hypothetical protein
MTAAVLTCIVDIAQPFHAKDVEQCPNNAQQNDYLLNISFELYQKNKAKDHIPGRRAISEAHRLD